MKHIYLLSSVLLFLLFVGCADDPDISGEVHNALPPTVKTGDPKDPTASTVEISGEVVQENGSKVTERGFIWGGVSPLTFDNKEGIKTQAEEGKGEFSATIEHLKDSSTYYIRAYAINAKGISLGEEKTFPTCSGLGLVRTFVLLDSIRSKSAVAGGVVLEKGGAAITKRGIYYAKSKEILGSLQKDSAVSAMETDSFVCKLIQLDSITTYYVQAFVVNEFGLSLGKVDSLKTTDGKPVVGSVERVSVGYTNAEVKAVISAQGDNLVTLRGFCYGTSTNLSIDRNDTIHCGDGIGEFSGLLAPLQSEKQYYVKAFAVNSLGVSYSNNSFIFTTLSDKPTVSTLPNAEIVSIGSIKVGGELVGQGSTSVSVVGFCWGTSANPTIESNDTINVSFDGIGDFEGLLTGLKGGRIYHIRAFAENDDYLTYGEDITFTTPNIFESKADFSAADPRVAGTASFVIGNTGYVLGGDIGNSFTDELLGYNAIYNTWDNRKSFTGSARKWMSAVGYGSVAYVFGGIEYGGNVLPGEFYKYMSDNNEWIEVTTTGAPDPFYDAKSVLLNSDIYFIGGRRDTITNDSWTYNPSTNSWTQKNDFPDKQHGGIALVIDGTLYAGLGTNDSGVNRKIWSTIDGSSWTEKTEMPSGTAVLGVAYKGLLYVLDDTGIIRAYNPSTNGWTQKSTLPGNDKKPLTMFVLNDQIYIGYGRNSFVTYDPTWDL